MAKSEAVYARKVKRAARILMYRRHRQPGVKGWELKRSLGREYLTILDLLDQHLDALGLQVKTVYEESPSPEEPTEEQLNRARFYLTVKDSLTKSGLVTSGWRVDDIAALVVAVAYIISKQGKASRREIEEILREKFPQWRVKRNLNRFARRGYLSEDEGLLYLGWRARAEIDQKALLKLVIAGEAG